MADQINGQAIQTSISKLLSEATRQLALFLEGVLPSIFEDWWQESVVSSLSFQQRRRLEQRNSESLALLDLAALLRILDQNWYQVSTKLNLRSEARHFVKEMQTIRNRWAHAATESFSAEDIYRDLDTLHRFASVINGNKDFLQELRAIKASILSRTILPVRSGTGERKSEPEHEEPFAEFEAGQIVFLKSNPATKGAIVAILQGKPENRYKVFLNGDTQTYYASQLQAEDQLEDNIEFLPCEHFHSYLTSLQIRYPGLSTLYSLNAARVDFIPYQFRPVLKFIRSDRPRLLIADGVGVGKTIEAGLILRELQARRDVRSVLIICPRPLVTERKWLVEMKRFDERFTHLDGSRLRHCINEMDIEGVWPEQYQKVIIPYSLFDEDLLYGSGPDSKRKRKKGLINLDPPPRFDLVIVDEAHHIRNSSTYSHRAVRFFCDYAEAVIFLTATPIQLGSHDLFVLLNTLRPDLIIDQESFEHMTEPNPFINQAVNFARAQGPEWMIHATEALDHAASTSWGQAILKHNPEFQRIRNRLAENSVGFEERVQFITDIEALHTLSGIINRTRRRDIGAFSIRKPETVVVEFTPAQKKFHDELLQVQADIFKKLHGDANVNFMMTTIRRRAASCIFGLIPFLEDILNRRLDEVTWEGEGNADALPQANAFDNIRDRIQHILNQARTLDQNDPKLNAVLKVIRDKQVLPNNKIILFSSFRHTLEYLFEHLQTDGFRIGLIHGDIPDEERAEIRNRFVSSREQEDALDVLLFSEIGCEGLDYQFCDCIVNYDLPWNPMRVEQRIGRIDRQGQKSESVAIFNLVTPGTVDADIYERCLIRIGVFNSALGGSEEILGEIAKEIRDIADNFSLTEEERRVQLQQLADNKIRLIQEQEELEQRQLELFGIRLPQDQMKKDIEEASSFWLSPNSIGRLVSLYLQETCAKGQEFILGEKPLKTLRLSQEARNALLQQYQSLPRQNSSMYREWENWLKGGNPHLPITFESECASQHPEAVFIMPLHPLVKQAAMSSDARKRVVTALKVKSNEVPAGKYEFAIYQWKLHGIREDLLLRPVASSEAVKERLSSLLEKAGEAEKDETGGSVSPWDDLDTQHYRLWSEARTEHRRRTQEIAEYRRESLNTSHQARISLLEEQIKQVSDEKIQKMRQAQISAAEADYARRIQDLEIAMERADIIAEPVAYGLIQVDGDAADAKRLRTD
jgi:SNF2 family DNA or RNA helicase